MHVDRLIENNATLTPSNGSVSCASKRGGVISRLVRRFLSLLGIALVKDATLKQLDSLKSGLERNAAFARHFVIERVQVDQVYAMVADDASRLSLDRYLSYRFALPLLYDVEKYNSYALNTEYLLKKYSAQSEEWIPSLSGADKKITDIVIAQTFVAKQYMFDEKSLVFSGDTILDCGCFLGETAIYFAKLCAGKGRVYTFEPDTDCFASAIQNVKNNGFDNIIEVVNAATVAHAGEADYSPCYKEKVGSSIPATTIDDFCRKNSVSVDIIKMDIEGAEYDALVGAKDIIQRDKPILMISAYHKPDDIFKLPEFINDLDCGYKIYFRDRADFVLFAIPSAREDRLK